MNENQSEIGVEEMTDAIRSVYPEMSVWVRGEDEYLTVWSQRLQGAHHIGSIRLGGGRTQYEAIADAYAKLPSPPVERKQPSKFGEFFTCWARAERPDRPDFVGVRTLPDGRREYLTHNEGMCYPYYLTIEGFAAPVAVERTQDEPKPSESDMCICGYNRMAHWNPSSDCYCVSPVWIKPSAAGSEEPKRIIEGLNIVELENELRAGKWPTGLTAPLSLALIDHINFLTSKLTEAWAAPVASQAQTPQDEPKRPEPQKAHPWAILVEEANPYMDYLEGRVRELEARLRYWRDSEDKTEAEALAEAKKGACI